MSLENSETAVDAAFSQLIAAIDTDLADLDRMGREVFHNVSPRQALGVLQRVRDRKALRSKVVELNDLQKHCAPMAPLPSIPQPLSKRKERAERTGPGLIRNIEGMSDSEAAKHLGVKPAKIREWLESGTLKGYRRVSGKWKIAKVDLIAFMRERRDLL